MQSEKSFNLVQNTRRDVKEGLSDWEETCGAVFEYLKFFFKFKVVKTGKGRRKKLKGIIPLKKWNRLPMPPEKQTEISKKQIEIVQYIEFKKVLNTKIFGGPLRYT